jgi:hypothetical protein
VPSRRRRGRPDRLTCEPLEPVSVDRGTGPTTWRGRAPGSSPHCARPPRSARLAKGAGGRRVLRDGPSDPSPRAIRGGGPAKPRDQHTPAHHLTRIARRKSPETFCTLVHTAKVPPERPVLLLQAATPLTAGRASWPWSHRLAAEPRLVTTPLMWPPTCGLLTSFTALAAKMRPNCRSFRGGVRSRLTVEKAGRRGGRSLFVRAGDLKALVYVPELLARRALNPKFSGPSSASRPPSDHWSHFTAARWLSLGSRRGFRGAERSVRGYVSTGPERKRAGVDGVQLAGRRPRRPTARAKRGSAEGAVKPEPRISGRGQQLKRDQ